MELSEFIDELKVKVEDLLEQRGYTVQRQEMKKVNEIKDALVIRLKDESLAPAIYVDQHFQEYLNGRNMNSIAGEIADHVERVRGQMTEIESHISSYSSENLFATVVNTEMNQDLLQTAIHVEYEDLSVIPRYKVTDEASFVVNHNMTSVLKMTETEILEKALTNTKEKGYMITPIENVLHEMIGFEYEQPTYLYVISNPEMVNGAVAILDKDWMKDLSEQLQDDLFIIPSSRHELLVTACGNGQDVEGLKSIVAEVNSSVVDKRDFLSNNVYHYNAKTKEVCIAGEKVEKAVEKTVDSVKKSAQELLARK